MKFNFSDLWRWDGTMDRGTYALIGLIGFAIKHNLDRLIATGVFHRRWDIFNYWIPLSQAVQISKLNHADAVFLAGMLALSLPFIWIGVALTLRRLRSAGLPPSLVMLFFAPYVNLAFFLLLAVLPARETFPVSPQPREAQRSRFLDRLIPANPAGSAALAVLLTGIFGAITIAIGVQTLGTYGWGIFIALPFCLGLFSVLIYGYHQPRRNPGCLMVSAMSVGFVAAALLAFAFEGIFCLAMAAPIALGLALLGGQVGFYIQRRRWAQSGAPATLMVLLLASPLLMGAEYVIPMPIPRFQVQTAIDIQAPPEVVWNRLVAFPELQPAREWPFRLGIAYPIAATLQGQGIDARRECRFSTGNFSEPIQVWDAPHHFRFAISGEPLLMQEWTPYARIQPRHLSEHYFQAESADFVLVPLPGGRTRLEGTTTYQNRMWPASYWRLWSDAIVHHIHLRVFRHIRQLAERDAQATTAATE